MRRNRYFLRLEYESKCTQFYFGTEAVVVADVVVAPAVAGAMRVAMNIELKLQTVCSLIKGCEKTLLKKNRRENVFNWGWKRD
jgi:hypothetical protein